MYASCGLGNAAGAEKVFFPVGIVEAVLAHALAGARRMHEPVIARENADVGVFFPRLFEEQQIAFPHVARQDRQGALP